MTGYHPGQTIHLGEARAYILSLHHTASGDEIVAAVTAPNGAQHVTNLRVEANGHLAAVTAATTPVHVR